MIKVLAPDIKSYEAFLHEVMFKLPGVTHVRSSVVLKEVKAFKFPKHLGPAPTIRTNTWRWHV